MRNALQHAVSCTVVVLAALPAAAADSATVYDSGVLVLAFVALCALVVVAQLVPVTLLMMGLIRGIAGLFGRGRLARQEESRRR